MSYYYRSRLDQLTPSITTPSLTPSKSAEVLPNFDAKKVYSYLCDNSIPVQNSPYNTLSYRSNNTNISPKQYLNHLPVQQRKVQNYFVGSNTLLNNDMKINLQENYSSKTIVTMKSQQKITQIANKNFQLPIQKMLSPRATPKNFSKPTMVDKQSQAIHITVQQSSQTLKTVQLFKQTQCVAQFTSSVQTQTQGKYHVDSSAQTDHVINLTPPRTDQSTKYRNLMVTSLSEQGSIHPLRNTQQKMAELAQLFVPRTVVEEDNLQPRQATSFFQSNNSMSQDSETLMQLVFLNDPYIFTEMEEMKQFTSVQKLIEMTSKVLDEQLADLEPSSYIENKNEVNGRAQITLKLFSEVISKALEAIARQQEESPTNEQRNKQSKNSLNSSVREYKAPWEMSDDQDFNNVNKNNRNMPRQPTEYEDESESQLLGDETNNVADSVDLRLQQMLQNQDIVVDSGMQENDNLQFLIDQAKMESDASPRQVYDLSDESI